MRPAASRGRNVDQCAGVSASRASVGNFEPCVELVEGPGQWRGRRVNPRMRHNCQEFVQAWPGDRPRCCSFRKLGKARVGDGVKRRILTMGVNQNIGIDGNQAPRSW